MACVSSRAAEEPLVVETTVHKVVVDSGNESLAEAVRAAPNDILVYRATYRNNGDSTLRELTAMMPIPPGLVYLPGSAKPAAIEATRDGQTFFRLDADPLPAPMTTWRALRWAPRDLAAGSEFTIELRARVAVPTKDS